MANKDENVKQPSDDAIADKTIVKEQPTIDNSKTLGSEDTDDKYFDEKSRIAQMNGIRFRQLQKLVILKHQRATRHH